MMHHEMIDKYQIKSLLNFSYINNNYHWTFESNKNEFLHNVCGNYNNVNLWSICFHPFCGIIYNDNIILIAHESTCRFDWSHKVKAPFYEWLFKKTSD